MAGPRLLRAFADSYPEARFVEVGANDGDHHDHLRPLILSRRWSGVMVEPVPYIFDRLRKNYGDLERVRLLNVAIADRDGSLPFYFVRDASPEERRALPDWYDGIGSLSRSSLIRHRGRIPDIDERVVEREVPCMRFGSLCDAEGIDSLDLLVIDTEGYDWDVLEQVDLDSLRPRLIVYEHFHIERSARRQARDHLSAHGYEIMEEGFDTFALDVEASDSLSAFWRRLRPAVPGVTAETEE